MDIVKTITTKIRRHNFTFREGRRIYYGLQMDTTRLVWSRNLGELEIARREVNFVKTLILDYPDMAAEVTDEELDGIYGRLVGVKSSSVETIREEERHRIRRLSIAAYRETCLRKGDQCCSVCDCCPFSQAFVEKLAELTAVEGCQ